MAIVDLFSKRQRRLREQPTDILTYDSLPQPLRVQIVQLLNELFQSGTERRTEESYFEIVKDILVKEYGVFKLNDANYSQNQIVRFILNENEVERVLDAIELSLRVADRLLRKDINPFHGRQEKDIDEAIQDFNNRFKERGIGYSYESGEIIKVDSTYMHSEVVKPTLQLLFKPEFNGANEEYLNAHEHYRHGRNKECLTECLKAFESTMKIICKVKGWVYDEKDTASKLIALCFNNGLIPSYLQTQFTSFKALLESGIPTIRNRLGGHGQGSIPTKADDETTRYALNLTGSNLIYLIELSGI